MEIIDQNKKTNKLFTNILKSYKQNISLSKSENIQKYFI